MSQRDHRTDVTYSVDLDVRALLEPCCQSTRSLHSARSVTRTDSPTHSHCLPRTVHTHTIYLDPLRSLRLTQRHCTGLLSTAVYDRPASHPDIQQTPSFAHTHIAVSLTLISPYRSHSYRRIAHTHIAVCAGRPVRPAPTHALCRPITHTHTGVYKTSIRYQSHRSHVQSASVRCDDAQIRNEMVSSGSFLAASP